MDPDVKKVEQESKTAEIQNQTKREDFFSGSTKKGGESKTDTLNDDEMFDDFDKSSSMKVSFNIGDHVIHRGKKAVIERKKAAETYYFIIYYIVDGRLDMMMEIQLLLNQIL